MAKEKKLVEAITSMEEDFAQWYTDVVKKKRKLCGYTSVKGCMAIKPAGYALWENIQHELDKRFKETGVQNVYMPMFISGVSSSEGEGSCRRLCSGGCLGDSRRDGTSSGKTLRTSYLRDAFSVDFYQKDIQSHRDLPKVYNQWCSVVRWEKTPVPSFAPENSCGRKDIPPMQLPKRRRRERSRC